MDPTKRDTERSEKDIHIYTMSSAADITLSEFNSALARYPALIKTFASKSTKEGVTPLEELDRFRYVEAPQKFKKNASTFTIKDLEKLVDWKLRHGAYRPGFLKKVAKNSDEKVKSATEDAFKHYREHPEDIAEVISKIKEPLQGVGPATASLLLAIHDPDHVIFFSDEVYKWLVNEGDLKPNPKYTTKEFEAVHAAAKTLASRLSVNPLQIEKVAFVIIKESEPVREPKPKPVPSGRGRGRPALPDSEKKQKPAPSGRGRGRPATGRTPKPPTARTAVAKAPKAPKEPKSPTAPAPAKSPASGKKRGRPAKAAVESNEGTATPASKKRKASVEEDTTATPASKKNKSDDAATPASSGRGRGRPKKA
ncbi:DUF1479 domain protein [Rutstroemia sp. NJR-2017a BVV2]|nr:DUF1479 domain protein [Rutstroemia sp. NJR-2017a BVV2]